ncbi:ATPase [Xylocopilactobacillus apicola]|uniref:UDP-N-acetylglucosamine kinase n=1 Tax=Xylocopilactobacillus apicola TaxID=2932184 RepID=A0AAU9CZN8_9LACO|nr:ATPase [Xylocopilactobacillus apicola]BDR59497.1 hypothetical protein XA3_19380 [Xylocopilactobacillus apicola]
MKKQYIIVAGVNGAGKSTLYGILPELFAGTKRINADEILQELGGDWRNPVDYIRAMREEGRRLHQALANKTSIHFETTLAGAVKAHLNLIEEARKNDFEVTDRLKRSTELMSASKWEVMGSMPIN